MTCGHEKRYDGSTRPLVCNLDAGHEGDHGVRQAPGLPPFVTWRKS